MIFEIMRQRRTNYVSFITMIYYKSLSLQDKSEVYNKLKTIYLSSLNVTDGAKL